jgi:sulfopyruvate decarboxylase subunit beta
MECITDEIVVCNIGHPSQELFSVRDRPENFYMLGSMGLASSIGLGLALSTHRTVVVIDGDGATLMNLGSLATIGAKRPKNYVLIIIDNEAYGSTGFQPTFTSGALRLDRIARACAIDQVLLIEYEKDIEPRAREVLGSADGPSCIVIKTEKGMPDTIATIPHNALWLRDRFMKTIAS